MQRRKQQRVIPSLTCPVLITAAIAATVAAVPHGRAQTETEPAAAADPGADLEQVVVTATRLPRLQQDIAGTVTVIQAEELERRLSDDLDDIVRYEPGLSMNRTARGGNQGFIIRGIGGNRVLMVVDGVRSNDIYAAGPSAYGKDAFEVDDLRAVEIIRGPASVLYGADALGGAVIFTTKDPQDYLDETAGGDTYLALRAAGSSADQQNKLGFTAATQWGDWGMMAQYTRRDFQELEIEGTTALDPQDGTSDNLLLKGVWRPAERHRLTLAFDTQQEEIDTRLVSDLSDSVERSQGRDESDRYRFSVEHHWQWDNAVADHLETQVYWQDSEALQQTQQRRNNSYSFGIFTPSLVDRVSDFEFNQQIEGIGATLVKGFTTASVQHALVYGFSWERTDTERPRQRCETDVASGARSCEIRQFFPGAPAEVFPNKTFPDTETERAGLYIQNEITLPGRLTVIPGLRYDRYQLEADLNDPALVDTAALGFGIESIEESELSASLGIIYDIDASIALFAQYAEGFRAPNFDEANQSFINLAFRYATLPNPDLKPETSRGYEVGIKGEFERARFSFALFDNHYDDFIDDRFIGLTADGISLFQQQNVAEARIYGAELSATWRLDSAWQLRGSLAYSRGDDEDADMPLDQIEPLSAVLGAAYNAAGNLWGLEAIATLVDKKDRVSADDRVTAAGYGFVDLLGHYNFSEQLGLRFGVLNLFNKQYARWSNIEGLPASALSAIGRGQEAGTELRVGLDLRF